MKMKWTFRLEFPKSENGGPHGFLDITGETKNATEAAEALKPFIIALGNYLTLAVRPVQAVS